MSIIARCYDPGYNLRGTVILEGRENIGKTWLTESLAFDHRFETAFEFRRNEEGYEPTRKIKGMVVVELADKGGIDSKTPEQIRAFLTQTRDVNRRMHQDDVEHIKRISTFVITCNDVEGYLKGDGEDTRFYPCHCETKIDVEAIIAELPQIYAQAKYLWEMGISPRPTEIEMEMQRQQIKPRQAKSNYYYWVLEKLRQNRAQMLHEADPGFTMKEMINWCENEPWFPSKPRSTHEREIRKTLEISFNIKSSVKKITVFYQTEGGPKTTRKLRYQGDDWATFIDAIED